MGLGGIGAGSGVWGLSHPVTSRPPSHGVASPLTRTSKSRSSVHHSTSFQVQTSTSVQYLTTAHGQTYGPDLGPSNPGQASTYHGPKLVWVQATNGKSGYVYAAQLNGPIPKSPQQAIAMNAQYPRTIPVYARNGTTVIGKFVIGGTGHLKQK